MLSVWLIISSMLYSLRLSNGGSFPKPLTAREERARDHVFGPEDLVILGAPVYAGRLPQLEGGIFERLRGDGTPAVFNVSYGNRAFEDALLEEQDICQAHGFHGIAAGAWIAPHTFSGRIGAGRPDGADLEKVREPHYTLHGPP